MACKPTKLKRGTISLLFGSTLHNDILCGWKPSMRCYDRTLGKVMSPPLRIVMCYLLLFCQHHLKMMPLSYGDGNLPEFDIILPLENFFQSGGGGSLVRKVYSCEYSDLKKEAPGAFLWENCSQVLDDATNQKMWTLLGIF